MLISHLTRARVAGHDELVDIGIAGGTVTSVRPSGNTEVAPGPGTAGVPGAPGATGPTGPTGVLDAAGAVDVGGRVVIAALVDAHVHLDKAYLNDFVADGASAAPDLPGAIAAVEQLRPRLGAHQVRAGAERAATALVRHGVVAARAHVEIGPDDPASLVELHIELSELVRPSLALQLCAFPQHGLASAATRQRWSAALDGGLDVVGGCPYTDDDPERHLDLVYALAERHRAPIDLHLDFSDDPDRSQLGLVVERTRAHAMEGQVTVGHCTSLAFLPAGARSAALEAMAAAGIALVALPATDLYLAGRGDPGTRGLAPIELARAAGVRTAIANNNIANPFAPFGNANLLQAAWLAGLVRRADSVAARDALLDAITHVPAALLGRPVHGPQVGAVASLAVLDTHDPRDIVAQAPVVVATVSCGRLVHRATGLG